MYKLENIYDLEGNLIFQEHSQGPEACRPWFIVPFEDAIIREIDIHVESTTLFYFALEKVDGE